MLSSSKAITARPEMGRVVESGGVRQEEVRQCLRRLQPFAPDAVTKIRLGDPGDGGYVMLDDFADAKRAISLGIGDNVSWDLALAERGLMVDQFDGEILASPVQHVNFSFKRLHMTPTAASGTATLEGVIGLHEAVILKIDIEASEWDVLDATPSDTLRRCHQIAVEFHDLRLLSERTFFDRAARVFAHLTRTHAVVHVHANNYNDFYSIQGVPLPDVLELTFALRERHTLAPSYEVFPGRLDFANCNWKPDLVIGSFRF